MINTALFLLLMLLVVLSPLPLGSNREWSWALCALWAGLVGLAWVMANLRRAAELVNIPNERLLQIYETLRPRRATWQELIDLSEELTAQYDAVENARFVREAAEAYRINGLLRLEDN